MTWYEELMQSADGVISKVGPDGKEVIVQIGKDAVSFLSANRSTLIRLGRESFVGLLQLIQDGRQAEAEAELIRHMNAWELIAKMNANADDIEKLAKLKEEWQAFLKSFLIKLSSSAATSLLKILLL